MDHDAIIRAASLLTQARSGPLAERLSEDLRPKTAADAYAIQSAIVGGLGQAYGAIAGGFLIGFAETLAVFDWSVLLRPLQPWLPFEVTSGLSLVPTEYKLTVSFVILVIVLLARPTGIFKGAST